jgi:RND family efflux transporter MFP subunit
VSRNVFVSAVCVGILSLGVLSFQGLSSLKEEPPRTVPEDPVLQVTVFEAESADVQRIISGFGTARSDRIVVVSAEVAGRILEADRLKIGRPVVGDHVEITADGRSQRLPGDVLVRIDPQVYEQELERARTLIEQDNVELRQLEQDHAANLRLLEQERNRLATITEEYQKKKALVDQGAGSESDLRRVDLEMKQYAEAVIRLETEVDLYPGRKELLERQRAVHESALELARIDVEKTTIRPPFSGHIADVMAEEGQYMQVGQPLFSVTNNDLVEIPVAVSLTDSAGIAAELTAGRYPEVALAESETAPPRWFGNVMRIAPVADEQTRTVDVFVEVRNDDQDVPLRPGAFVHARIEGPVLSDVVLIPRDAIIDGSVFVIADAEPPTETPDAPRHQAQRRRIQVGQTVQSLARVEHGIHPGDRLVLTNLDVIEEGTLLQTDVVRNLDDELSRHDPAYAERVSADDGPGGSAATGS